MYSISYTNPMNDVLRKTFRHKSLNQQFQHMILCSAVDLVEGLKHFVILTLPSNVFWYFPGFEHLL